MDKTEMLKNSKNRTLSEEMEYYNYYLNISYFLCLYMCMEKKEERKNIKI